MLAFESAVDAPQAPFRKFARVVLISSACYAFAAAAIAQDTLPFKHALETFRNKDGDVIVFALRLEQPFLAEEFEQSNYLRIQTQDERAHLIYPRETRFVQKHAAFYGRLRGEGVARLRLEYEIVSENPDGSRRIDARQGELSIPIPSERGGPEAIFADWARQQAQHFSELLTYYPHETLLEYCLLQSQQRYGVRPASLPSTRIDEERLEAQMYGLTDNSLDLQQTLQRKLLTNEALRDDLDTHISLLDPPPFKSLDYEALLRERRASGGSEPAPSALAVAVPENQYFLHFRSAAAADELFAALGDWGRYVQPLVSAYARDDSLLRKFERQLTLDRDELKQLFKDGALSELALTGSDLALASGTDVSIVLRIGDAARFDAAFARWRGAATAAGTVTQRDFNYRGETVSVAYSDDRTISSFAVRSNDVAIISNSHVTLRRMVDALVGSARRLCDAPDYRYATCLLPPADEDGSGYFFASDAFLRRQTAPATRISEKRRKQCFNNLVMLNNASLFYRLENGRSPQSLGELAQNRFVDASRLICPHGGAYAFDPHDDAATCSLHNRLKYLTPNAELEVLKISDRERAEYGRVSERFRTTWAPMFAPIACRIRTGERMRLEGMLLPLANSTLDRELREQTFAGPALVLGTGPVEPATIATLGASLGRARIGEYVRAVPGIAEVLAADPTLTDLNWLGDRVSICLADADSLFEVDPLLLRPINLFGEISVRAQSLAAAGMLMASLPAYAAIDVEDSDRAERFLRLLSSHVFLRGKSYLGFETAFDGYRLPAHADKEVFVFSFRWYSLKVRLYAARVDNRLVAATSLAVLHRVIDAAAAANRPDEAPAHARLQLRLEALNAFRQNLEVYWAERSRVACHNNLMTISSLRGLYGVPIEKVNALAEAKYGVTYFCPDGGTYREDPGPEPVVCSIHGTRQRSSQDTTPEQSLFSRLLSDLKEVTVTGRFEKEATFVTFELRRSSP